MNTEDNHNHVTVASSISLNPMEPSKSNSAKEVNFANLDHEVDLKLLEANNASSTNTKDNYFQKSNGNNNRRYDWKSRVIEWKPNGNLTEAILWITLPAFTWSVLFLLLGPSALPKGTVFSIFILQVGGLAAGYLLKFINLPQLLGMLIVGIALRNIADFNNEIHIQPEVSSTLRQVALVVILIRAGLGLDPEALLRLKGVVIRLAFLPCLFEATAVAITTRFILDFPWAWGFLLGFVLSAVSPAVVVPTLLSFKERGYGVEKGIPTIVIAASSVDDILAISAFGVTLGFALSSQSEDGLLGSLIQGPIEIILGIGFGLFSGCFMGFLLCQHEKDWEYGTVVRTIFPLATGIIAVFGSNYISYPGAGALACLTAAFVAAIVWRKKGILADNDALSWNFSFLWYLFEPQLFGLIGREIDLFSLDKRILGLGLLCVLVALTVRLLISYLAVAGAGLNTKEKLFVSISWIPKATVQAAIGSVALDTARTLQSGAEAERLGLEVLTIAVLVILITAPLGSVLCNLLGPKLLSRKDEGEELIR